MSGSQNEKRLSAFRLRWIGYGLLLLALLDAIQVFIPPNFMNPVWELQAMGALVERVPVSLLGFALVFFGEDIERAEWEEVLLKVLSWLTILLAILFFLLVPLGIVDTVRINSQANARIDTQVQQQQAQLTNVETRLQQGTPQDIQNVAVELNRLGIPVDTQKPDELKTQILSRVAAAKTQIQPQANAARSNQRLALLKNSVKWNLGALIAGALFVIIWRSTRWAR